MTRVSRSPGDVTRAGLLEAASSLIVERGWGSVTTRAVAERAGVNQALVHYHFGNMDNLLREAVVARMEPEIGALIDELLDDRAFPESIGRTMQLLDRFDLGTDVGVLMAEALLRATRDKAMSDAMSGVVAGWQALLEPRLVTAQQRGVVRADVDARSLALIIGAAFDGFLFQRMADPGIDAASAADTLARLIAPVSEVPR
jgi:AcrR family transcriptional regulator